MPILSQTPLPETPKTSDVSAWFGWVATVLGIMIVSALGYLIKTSSEKDAAADKATDKMVEVFREMIQKLDSRHEDEVKEHAEDRRSHNECLGQVKDALITIDKTQQTIAHELTNIKDEIKRSGNGGGK